ncbi:hypothetical protein IT418_01380 [bacterium]|nr:hypothetical protein [bacterium]
MNIFTVIYLSLIVGLTLLFFLRSRVEKLLVLISQIVLIVSLAGAVSSLFLTRPFVYLAEFSLQNAGTLDTIKKIDAALPITKVVTPVQDLVEKIQNLWRKDSEKPPLTVVEQPQKTETGILEAEVYPSIVAVITQLYKSTTMLVSLMGLILSVYLNFSLSNVNEVAKLKRQYFELAKKLDDQKT